MWQLLHYFKRYQFKQKQLYLFSIIILLYTIVDGMVTFFLPLVAKEILHSMALVGIILASSSVWDIVADVFLGFRDGEVEHKRLIRLAFFLVLILLGINALPIEDNFLLGLVILLLSMILWGFHYEYMVWGTYDFIIDTTDKEDQATSFGVVEVFRSLGYAIGPIIAGTAILVSFHLVLGSAAFLGILALLLFVFFSSFYQELPTRSQKKRRLNWRAELHLWKKIGSKILPLLIMTFSLGIFNGVVFSLTPILVETKESFSLFGGFIVGAFWIPMILFTGWFGQLADRWGKKQFILLGSFLVIIALSVFGLVANPWVALTLALVAGTGTSMFYPALNAQYSNYIEDHIDEEKEAIGEMGVSVNLGFISGASLGGIFVSLTGGFWAAYFLVALAFMVSGVVYYQRG